MAFFKNKSTRAVILIMIAFVVIGILIARIYYQSVNNSYDPRVLRAKELYQTYNKLAPGNNYEELFLILDSIETIYHGIAHYRNSYETGVVYNNKAAIYLTELLNYDSIAPSFNIYKDSITSLAEIMVKKSITVYENWLKKFQNLSEEQISAFLVTGFDKDFSAENSEIKKYHKQRVVEILDAQKENKRRLSVAYTNLGVIYRQKGDYKEAAGLYKKAMDLWQHNLAAENNLNAMLGRPLKTRNFIQKLFPPDKNK
jgi:tetratricopeptide (TPR) repeat protein